VSGAFIASQDPEGHHGRARGSESGECTIMQLLSFAGAPGMGVLVEVRLFAGRHLQATAFGYEREGIPNP